MNTMTRSLCYGLAVLGCFAGSLVSHAEETRAPQILSELPADTPFVFVSSAHATQWEVLSKFEVVRHAAKFMWDAKTEDSDLSWKDLWTQIGQLEQGSEVQRFIIDLLSHEIYIYGDRSWIETSKGMSSITSKLFAKAAELEKQNEDLTDNEKAEAGLKYLRSLPDEEFAKIQIPNLVFGARLQDPERALRMLDLLKKTIKENMDPSEIPAPYNQAYSVEEIEGGSFYTVTIPGSWIPFYLIDRSQMSRAQEEYLEFFLDGIRNRNLILSAGIQGDQLKVTIGGTLDGLTPATGEKSLLEHAQFQVLKDHPDQTVTSIRYVSQELAQLGYDENEEKSWLIDYAQTIRDSIKPDQSAQQKMITEQVADDCEELGKDLAKFRSKPGGWLTVGYLGDNAYEWTTFDWAEHPERDASQALSVLNQVGRPAFVRAYRDKYRPEVYEFRSKWLSRSWWYVNKALMFAGEDAAGYGFLMAMAKPTLAELDQVTREEWLPAFQDGQAALVLDSANLEQTPHPLFGDSLPWGQLLPQVAWVQGVSDQQKLKKAVGLYRDTINRVCAQFNAQGEDGELFQVPAAQVKLIGRASTEEPLEDSEHDSKLPTLYQYGVEGDGEVLLLPVAATGGSFATVATDSLIAERIVTPSEQPMTHAWIDTNAPAWQVVQVDFPKLYDFAIAVLQAAEASENAEQDKLKIEVGGVEIDVEDEAIEGDAEVSAEVESELDVEKLREACALLGILKSYDSVTTLEEDSWITRSRLQFAEPSRVDSK